MKHLGLPLKASVARFVTQIDFSQPLLGGTLSFLLVAGALQIEWDQLREQRWRIPFLAVGTTVLSTLLVATFAWLIFYARGMTIPPIYCLLFGAFISPTDPIAVVEMLKRAGIGRERALLLTLTCAVAAFSILVQGTTMPWLLQHVLAPRADSGQPMERAGLLLLDGCHGRMEKCSMIGPNARAGRKFNAPTSNAVAASSTPN